jgi:ParB-like chromosome segregation protein Spo0J
MAFITIDTIDTLGRQLEADEDLYRMAKSIVDQGLKFPVLLNGQHQLIDGLRRMEAARLAGFSTVEAIVAHTMQQAIDALTASHAGRPFGMHYPPRRLYDIYMQISELAHADSKRNETARSTHPRRKALSQALRLSDRGSESLVQVVNMVYNLAKQNNEEGEVARKAVEAMEAGLLTPFSARLRIYNWRRKNIKAITAGLTPAVIKRTIINATDQLLGIGIALEDVPRSRVQEVFTPEEAARLYTNLHRAQRAMAPIVAELKQKKLTKTRGVKSE